MKFFGWRRRACAALDPPSDHYDSIRDRRSAYRNLHNVVLCGDHHHNMGGDPSEKHEQRCP